MNIFNKIIVVLILLFLILVSLVSIVNEFIDYFKWSDVATTLFNPSIDINPFVSSLALLFVFAISIFLMLLEFYRKRQKKAKIYKVKDGNAMITVGSIAKQVENSTKELEGTQDINVKINPKNKGIIINMIVELDEDVNIPEKMQEIINMAKEVASEKLGIKILKTNLTIVNFKKGGKETARQITEEDEEDAGTEN
ncbi:MAG: alkaline shock response membrane anchor protein AmaP [Candidatus Humimicrobiaceae bacterium]